MALYCWIVALLVLFVYTLSVPVATLQGGFMFFEDYL